MPYEITTAGAVFTLATFRSLNANLSPVPDYPAKQICVWGNDTNVSPNTNPCYAQVLDVNTSTWAVTTAGAVFEFETTASNWITRWNNNQIAVWIDSTHWLQFWGFSSGKFEVFEVNTSTWAIATSGAALPISGSAFGLCLRAIPGYANRFLAATTHQNVGWRAYTLEVDTSTWAVTTTSSETWYWHATTTSAGYWGEAFQWVDPTHALVIYNQGNDNAQSITLAVNTSTWAVSTTSDVFQYAGNNDGFDGASLHQIDATRFLAVRSGNNTDGHAQVLAVNTSTWAVTTAGADKEWDTGDAQHQGAYQIDSTHVMIVYAGVDGDGFAQVLAVNASTWAVTTTQAAFEFDTQNFLGKCLARIDTTHFLTVWGSGTDEVKAQVLNVAVPATFSPKLIVVQQ